MGLKAGIIQTAYLTFSHNQIAIAFFIGIIVALLLAIYKPSRTNILLIIAFSLLLFGFEYDKHIVTPLQEQTLNSLNLDQSDAGAKKVISYSLTVLVPIGLFILGWGIIFLSFIYQTLKIKELKDRIKNLS